MRHIFALIALFLLTTPALAQDDTLNGEWFPVSTLDLILRIPTNDDGQPYRLGEESTLFFIRRDAQNAADFGMDFDAIQDRAENGTRVTPIAEEAVQLPVGEGMVFDYTVQAREAEGNERLVYVREYRLALPDDELLIARATLNITESDAPLEDFQQTVDAVMHTTAALDLDNSWPLYGDENRTMFMRAPQDWALVGSREANTLNLQADQLDALVSVSYRHLGAQVLVGSLEEQFAQAFAEQAGTVEAVSRVQLPIGDAIRIERSGVPVAAGITHTQVLYVVMRGETLILITTGAAEDTHDDVAELLQRIVYSADYTPQPAG